MLLNRLKNAFAQKSNFLRFMSGSAASNSMSPLTKKVVGAWLTTCSVAVAGTVVVGGITRLKNAGLSMVKWRLIDDMFLPATEKEWADSYEEYKKYPEYELSSMDITLEKYKQIYIWEYIHRIFGRVTGAIVILPALIFAAMKKLPRPLLIRSGIYSLLVLVQGAMGWCMVRSGLKKETMANAGEPGVSQYRLASHLFLAFVLFSLTTWQALALLSKAPVITAKLAAPPSSLIGKGLFMSTHIGLLAIFLTSMVGAFVAGLDAGKIYNTYPEMGEGRLVPVEMFEMSPAWKNFFENPATVQFVHRLLAHATAAYLFVMGAQFLRIPTLPLKIKFAAGLVVATVLYQMHLGIQTILSHTETETAASHQLTAMGLLASGLFLAFEAGRFRKLKLPIN